MMHDAEIGALAVATDGRLVGVITERDIVAACDAHTDFDSARVDAWMTPYPDAFTPEMTVDDAASWMLATGFRHLPVVDGGEMVGMISIKDVLWAVTEPPGR
jgi:CBS domain-containing protein